MSLMDRIRVSGRNVFVLFGLVLAGVYYLMSADPEAVYRPQIVSAQQQLQEAEKKLAETEERFQNKGKFQAELEQLSVDFRKALEYLPKEADVQDLVRKITKEARASDVEILDYKPGDSVAKDFYDELPMDLQFKGTYSQLMVFLDRVTKIPRIINIRTIDIANPSFDGGTARMDMKGTLVGYRYKEATK
jgi:type IV pilus assembly protein PilO